MRKVLIETSENITTHNFLTRIEFEGGIYFSVVYKNGIIHYERQFKRWKDVFECYKTNIKLQLTNIPITILVEI